MKYPNLFTGKALYIRLLKNYNPKEKRRQALYKIPEGSGLLRAVINA